jgi:hypothetical protein
MRTALIAAIGLSLAGCAGVNEAMTEYSGTDPVSYSIGGEQWRIFDQPENSRMMITTGISASKSTGANQGLTLGLSGNPYKKAAAFRPAATAYLAQRNGTITGGHLVLPYQSEFDYAC